MRTLLFICILSITHLSAFSQGIVNLWLSGLWGWAGPPYGGVNMDFSGGTLTISWESRSMYINATNGVICDENGNRLFYSNGMWIANAQNDTMLNGNGLNPSAYTSTRDSLGLAISQANLIIPIPGDTSSYYLFHSTVDYYGTTYAARYLYYSVIDMSLDGGLGAVSQKNVVLLSDTLVPGALTACKHGNGRDWWVICHEFGTNRYFKYLVTSYGILGPYPQSIGSIRDANGNQCCFSPNGLFFAHYSPVLNDLDIFNFDRCTGTFSSPEHIDYTDSAFSGGVAFSKNSNALYVSSQNFVYQYDMTATNIPTSQTTVAVYDSFFSPSPPYAMYFYLAQLAPDGKIYINSSNASQHLHVINYPDSIGIGCDLQQHGVALPAWNSFTIANHPNYFLGRDTGSVCDTLTGLRDATDFFEGINVFPNPSTRLLYIHFTNSEKSHEPEIKIYNTIGQSIRVPVAYLKDEYFEVNVSALVSGIYFVELLSDELKAVIRFVKQ